jgi:hypothetical protein
VIYLVLSVVLLSALFSRFRVLSLVLFSALFCVFLVLILRVALCRNVDYDHSEAPVG